MPSNQYKYLFQNAPSALIELDFSCLALLGKKLKKQTVTNVRKFLTEHPVLIKKAFQDVKVKEANEAAYQLFNTRSKHALNKSLISVFSASAFDVLIEMTINVLEGKRNFNGEFKYKMRTRRYQDMSVYISIPSISKKTLKSVMMSLQDITTWKKIERQLRKRAQLDGLTHLLNHNTIMQRLQDELIRAKRYGLSMSCMMIDLDHFKLINDKFGHPRGDQVLKRVATMIKKTVRTVDLVGRYGGDEFLIIMPETTPANARFAAQRIQSLFYSTLFKYQRVISFHISLSIGITGYPSKKIKGTQDVIALADKAMYLAKKSGRNRISVI